MGRTGSSLWCSCQRYSIRYRHTFAAGHSSIRRLTLNGAYHVATELHDDTRRRNAWRDIGAFRQRCHDDRANAGARERPQTRARERQRQDRGAKAQSFVVPTPQPLGLSRTLYVEGRRQGQAERGAEAPPLTVQVHQEPQPPTELSYGMTGTC